MLELRRDDIGTVGLYKTVARARIDTTREDDVTQSSYSAYSSLKTHWSEHVRTEVGLRADLFDFERAQQPRGEFGERGRFDRQPEVLADPRPVERDGVLRQRRQGLSQQRCARHDDSRRSYRRRDAGRRVDPLVDALGADVGVRTAVLPNVQLTASLWDTEATIPSCCSSAMPASPKPAARASGAASRPARSGIRSRG